MTIDEVSTKFSIPIQILEEYQNMGLCSEVKKVMGAWRYDDEDIERLSMIMTLHDIGFEKKEIEEYMKLLLKDEDTHIQRSYMLRNKRRDTLDEIHFKEKQLSTIDYLTHEINKMKRRDE